MPPSLPRAALHLKRQQNLTHIGTRPCHSIFYQVRRIVTVETAIKQDLDIRPLPPKISDPLRILFCGSDKFSCASLKALHDLHKAQPKLVESIDVLVRPGKRAGRGLKRLFNGPLFHLAAKLNLPIHKRDTFTGWALPLPGRVTDAKTGVTTIHPHPSGKARPREPHPFNLLIAVSFGLRVPPRILDTLEYGGLNIHPSLLPDLRGPAPIQWSILLNRPHTGCTLQTLHPTTFDRGAILQQTAPPGLPIPADATTADLLDTLATEGAALLVQGLQANLHVPPHPGSSTAPRTPPPPPAAAAATSPAHLLRDAPKITKADLAIDWGSMLWGRDHELYPAGQWTADDLVRRFRAVAAARGLWTPTVTVTNPTEQRLIFTDMEAVACPPALRDAVRAVLQTKLLPPASASAAGAGAGGEAVHRRLPFPDDMRNVVFRSQRDLVSEQREFRLPVFAGEEGGEYGTSVVLPVRVPYRVVNGVVEMVEGRQCDAVRVRRITVEGKDSKEASKALEPFWERNVRLKDIAGLEYAVDVIGKRVD